MSGLGVGPWTRGCAIWVMAFLATAVLVNVFLGINGLHWWRMYPGGRTEAYTVGEVVRAEPRNHQRVFYTYRVGSRSFNGSADGFQLEPGDAVRVYYFEDAPERSGLRPAGSRFFSALVPIVIACIAVPSLIVWRLRRRLRLSPQA